MILEGVELVNLGSIMYGFLYFICEILIVCFVVVQWTSKREKSQERAEYGLILVQFRVKHQAYDRTAGPSTWLFQ
ncbi:MAG: hypothetical protein EAX87_07390 [Candidatus Thorarchaeota archaeon]|nr:hypothetical protein [Candidatus Thorarchaeota archaeon]